MPVRCLSKWIVIIFGVLLGLGMGTGPLRGQEASGDAVKSAKERLSDKASDDQRVDNCKVPLEKRGPKPRPDCPAPEAADKSTPERPQGQ
jgi:hypothetical protein